MQDEGANGSCHTWTFSPSFVGWVPTVLGALSFRSIGQATFPSRAKYANISSLTYGPAGAAARHLRRRVILAFQSRNTSDDFFSRLTNFGQRNSLYFVLWADTDPTTDIGSKSLRGEIFVFATKERWKERARVRTRNIIDRLNDLSLSADGSRLEQALTDFDGEASLLRKDCSFHVEFGLLRNGEVFFSDLRFVDEHVQNASLEDASLLNYDLNERLVNQCFFFLRDLAHNHQHHAPDCDTMITLQRYDPSKPDDWKRNIAYALQYHVIDSKRRQEKSAMADAIGILAYRSAFIDSVNFGNSDGIPDDKHLRDSLRARIEDEHIPGRMFAFAQTTVGIYALFIAFLAILLQPLVPGSDIFHLIEDKQIGKWTLTSLPQAIVEYMPQIFFLVLLIVPFLIWSFLLPRDRKTPKGVVSGTIMDLYALGQMLSKYRGGFSLLAYYRLALILLGIVIIWQAYHFARIVKLYIF
jgi:hypothetical protein